MILFPAIDLKNGSCVRLVQGKMEDATIFNENPVDQAKYFESKGCKWIHIVDLDGAFQGKPVNEETIKKNNFICKYKNTIRWRNKKYAINR